MSRRIPQRKTTEELTKEWYEKLEKKGFKDIEQPDGRLKEWSSRYMHWYHPVEFSAKERYYQLAGQFLNEHEFEDKRERLIWEMHTEGAFLENIVFKVRKVIGTASKDKVQKIIDDLCQKMLKNADND